jgi:hypothetical protein
MEPSLLAARLWENSAPGNAPLRLAQWPGASWSDGQKIPLAAASGKTILRMEETLQRGESACGAGGPALY